MTIKLRFLSKTSYKKEEILKLGENICNTYKKRQCQEYLKTYKSIRSTSNPIKNGQRIQGISQRKKHIWQ